MKTQFYDRLIAAMPSGLERAIVQVLKWHVGRQNAIKKQRPAKSVLNTTDGIMEKLALAGGFRPHERQFRDAIRNLRRAGWLIASTSADGYFLVSDLLEYNEFRDSELSARIADLSETRAAMDAAARQRFGDAVQVGLL